MFGKMLDYYLLYPFTHQRNLKSEEELNDLAQVATVDIDNANSRLSKLADRLEGHLPISGSLRYLDVGCGTGDITLALAKAGCGHVTGIDFVPRVIEKARLDAKRLNLEKHVDFACVDIHDWNPTHRFDVILSHEALEHIRDPRAFLSEMASLLAPRGIAVLAFGPLFHSAASGDHMSEFFRLQIPWRGVLFSEQAILRLRRKRYRPGDQAIRYTEIVGGLNLLRYSDFLNYVAETGWEFHFLRVNPQLKRVPPLHQISDVLVRVPGIRDYVASSVYAVLRR